ncbi:ExbD/TolR family protein [Halorhodospira halophila]|uniref:Biopolymer transport protein ExbD/TolR n=1 Tax=Halorhodospira halophila (strain DSM 244 / SL1) TaxID=349124 RepID=A1WWG0_HALHL|nr:biopolymer transporter ExbD [Halorhodospira halophila]ABM62022.1 Biopolymer transport protein ExbD/TolR [Halorhodospira halophila SL1]MBK1728437.1 biopolymer transporter ExbD [Halorhodospira halophila]
MNLRRRQRRDEPELNLTPLIDVVFLLLIFFMVTTTFVDQVGLDITLPEAEQETEEAQPQLLEIGISAEGEYFVDGNPLVNREMNTLVRALEEALEAGEVAGIVVRADADAPHRAVVRALDGAGRVGIDRVSIATTRSDDL